MDVFTEYLLMFLLGLTAVFLILLVLVQRGRGGGLAGAFGGMGGQSAFGTKAGDLFTRITIGVAAFWILLCTASVKILNTEESKVAVKSTQSQTPGPAAPTPGTSGGTKPLPGVTPRGKDAADTKAADKPAATPSEKPAEKSASPPAEAAPKSDEPVESSK